MFKGFSTHLKRHRVKHLAFISLIMLVILVKVVLIDVVYISKQYEKKRIITPWGEK